MPGVATRNMVRAILPFALLSLALSCPLGGQDVRVRPVSELAMPPRPNADARPPDSNSPAFWRDGRLFWYGSHGSPWLSHGPGLFGPWETRAAFVPSPDNSPKWMEAVWPENDGVLWGWYHAEPVDPIPGSTLTAPKIGAAVSFDGGYTMNDLGFVLTSGDPIDPTAQNGYFAGGHGDPSVILDRQREYFYFFFGNYGGPAESQGVGVARMAFADRANPAGMVWKYQNGSWQAPGVGGPITPIFPVRKAWGAVDPDAFWGPAVHWNRHLNCYVMLLNRTKGAPGWSQEGIYISFNPDLSRPEQWTTPRKILDLSDLDEPGDYYPQVMGLEPGDTDRSAGQTARLYVHGISRWEIDFIPPSSGPTAATLTALPGPALVMGRPATLAATAMGLPPFTYQWSKDGSPLPQATGPTLDLPAVTAADAGIYTVIVSNGLGSAQTNSLTLTAVPPPPPPVAAFLSNLSVRSWLAGPETALTLGFALESAKSKSVLLRAVGPTLSYFGVADAAADPQLEVFDAGGMPIAANDNWELDHATAFAATGAFPLPVASTDAVLVVSAAPGSSTARVTATGPGVVLAEIYDPSASNGARLTNLSALAQVGSDTHALVGGFTVGGSGSKRLLIRALGPSLAAFGVSSAIAAPLLEVYGPNGALIATASGWDPAIAPDIASAGATTLPPGSADAAMIVTVAAGSSYTTVVRSTDGTVGEALLEIYELRQ